MEQRTSRTKRFLLWQGSQTASDFCESRASKKSPARPRGGGSTAGQMGRARAEGQRRRARQTKRDRRRIVPKNTPAIYGGKVRSSEATNAIAGALEDCATAFDRQDYAAALPQCRPLAEQGDARAQTTIGGMYYNGQGVQRDFAEARDC
jgi:hypothetical protein